MNYTVNENHPELRCPKCGSGWFCVTAFVRAHLHYNAERRVWVDDAIVDESAPMHPTAVACVDCAHVCSAVFADAFGPICEPPQAARRPCGRSSKPDIKPRREAMTNAFCDVAERPTDPFL
jgi:hypothetical protein